jgi:hypothetical protein
MSGVQTEAVPSGDGLFKILPTPEYETRKTRFGNFLQAKIVHYERGQEDSGEYIVAVKR